jgi:hypothetical protein
VIPFRLTPIPRQADAGPFTRGVPTRG